MQAITARDRAAGAAGLTLSDIPRPHAAENDVIVRVHAAGFTPGELEVLRDAAPLIERLGRSL